MAAWVGPAIQGGTALLGLLGGRKKEKGVQKQGIENFGFLLEQLGPALNQYIASIYGSQALQGAKVGQGLQAGLGRVGAGSGGLGSIGRGIGRAYGGTQGSLAAGQARYQGMSDIAGKAIGWATGSGPAQPPGPTPMQSFISNLGAYLLTQQGGGQQQQAPYNPQAANVPAWSPQGYGHVGLKLPPNAFSIGRRGGG